METQINQHLPQALRASVPFENISADEVELTDEEIQAILKRAKTEKAARMRMEAYKEKISKPLEYPKISYIDLGKIIMKHAKSIIPGFKLDEQNKEIFKLLCLYFTQDPEFEKAGYSLRKGLLLFGPIGCGKTTLMKLFQRNVTNDYVVRSVREVADAYTRKEGGGADALGFYSTLMPCYPNEHYGQTRLGMCFDDLGTEKNKKHFGNEINVMEDVFQNRYDNRLIGKTHLTTNLTGDEIDQMYGARVRSRLREMCNIIAFDEHAQDRRR